MNRTPVSTPDPLTEIRHLEQRLHALENIVVYMAFMLTDDDAHPNLGVMIQAFANQERDAAAGKVPPYAFGMDDFVAKFRQMNGDPTKPDDNEDRLD